MDFHKEREMFNRAEDELARQRATFNRERFARSLQDTRLLTADEMNEAMKSYPRPMPAPKQPSLTAMFLIGVACGAPVNMVISALLVWVLT